MAHHEPRIFAPLLWSIAAAYVVQNATHLLAGGGPSAARAGSVAGLLTVGAALAIYLGRLTWEAEQRRRAHRPRLLLVEPYEDDARIARRALEGHYEVEWVETVAEALDRLGRGPHRDAPAAVVTALLGFPDGTGADLARWARSHGLEGRVVVVTAARSDDPEVVAVRGLGVRAVLAKPIDARRLRRTLGVEG